MATIKISQLPPAPDGTGSGSPKGTDLVPATDTTDTTSAASGTTKKYTQSSILNFYLQAQGLTTYTATRVATTASLTVTYSNGASGVGATLTNAGVQAALSIDGVTLSVADRVLVKNQASTFQNGIYIVTTVGTGATNWVMTRALDYNEPSEIVQYGVVLVNQGTVNAGLLYQETAAGPFTIGTSPIVFAAYSAGSSASTGIVNAGTINQLAWYAATGNAVSGLATANNGLLVTSAGGVPSIGNAILADITINGITAGRGTGASATNTVFGASALAGSNTNTNAVVIGNNALNASTGSAANIIAIGYQAMKNTATPPAGTIVIGAGSLSSVSLATTSTGLTVIGTGSGVNITGNASSTTIVGNTSGNGVVSTSSNTVVGANSLNSPAAGNGFNSIVGANSAVSLTDQCNSFVGASALFAATTASFNVGLGYHCATADGTSGGVSLTTGDNNTFIGSRSGSATATISGATCIGCDSLAIASTGATSGDNGPGMSFGSVGFPVGFRGNGTIYSGGTGRGYWRPNINGTAYLMPCFIDGTLTSGAAMVTDGNGSPILTSTISAGQILIGTTAGAPTNAAINSGTGIIVANGSGSITISATGGGLAIATISGTTQSAAVNTTYIALNSGQTTVTLPAVYAVGDIIRLVGATANTGGWVLTASAGDTVRVNNSTTSSGGTVTCTAVAGQCIEVVCDVANTSWVMTNTASVLLTTA